MEEFRLLKHVCAATATSDSRVELAPGDDLAQIRLRGQSLLVGVDQLVAGRHYDPERTPVELVGRKAVTRALSDVAAMAGRPVGTLVAVALPPDYGEPRALALFEAMRVTAAEHESPLIGGDICIHGDPCSWISASAA